MPTPTSANAKCPSNVKVGAGKTASPEADLRVRLAAIEGLDLAQGLTIARNNFNFDVRLLSMFVAGHANDARQLLQLVEAGDLEPMECLIHELKGVTGNLGASKMHHLAASVLESLRQQSPDFAPQVVVLAEALEMLVADLRAALGKNP